MADFSPRRLRRPRDPKTQGALSGARGPCYRATMSALAAEATRNVRDTLAVALEHTTEHAALVVSDARSALSRLLTAAYRECLPDARLLSFDDTEAEALKAAFAQLHEKDLVVLIQSSVFRIPEYRARVELFRHGIKVIEHSNLDRISDDEAGHYVAALAYDSAYYRGVGRALKARMDQAASARIE